MPDWKIVHGDCVDQMRAMDEASVDSIVTDPPYGLEFMGKDWDAPWKSDVRQTFDGTMADERENPYARSKVRNGLGASYGAGAEHMQAFQVWCEVWARECLRVLKPGGYLLAFGGSRTYHRLACAVEDAGFEIRDQIMWLYGSGFPKSLDVSKALDKAAGAEREVVGVKAGHEDFVDRTDAHSSGGRSDGWDRPWKQDADAVRMSHMQTDPSTDAAKQWSGWGTSLKPAHEPIVVARKPLIGTVVANVLQHGTGAMNIDACRVPGEPTPINKLEQWSGFGQKKQPDYVQEINTLGRWPANVVHDGSEEVVSLFPDVTCGAMKHEVSEYKGNSTTPFLRGRSGPSNQHGGGGSAARFFKTVREDEPYAERTYAENGGTNFAMKPGARRLDEGSAARFFYVAKASQQDRNEGCDQIDPKQYSHDGRKTPIDNAYQRNASNASNASNAHPTVKPTALMRYLVKLVTPPGGMILDPFAGSGSTGKASVLEGFRFVGIEKDEEYCAIARARIAWAEEESKRGEAQQELFA